MDSEGGLEKPQLVPETVTAAKELQWKSQVELLGNVKDKLGKGIDAGIIESVAAINLLGINTDASCEGHTDHGSPAPWIDISPEIIDTELEEKVRLAFDEANKKSAEKAPKEVLEKLYSDAWELHNEFEGKNLSEVLKLTPYLEEFYKERSVPFNQRLVLQRQGNGTRLQPQGAIFGTAMNEAEKSISLASFQAEMKDFTAFLKGKFMGNS